MPMEKYQFVSNVWKDGIFGTFYGQERASLGSWNSSNTWQQTALHLDKRLTEIP
jgi:hypothetical protein